MIRMKLTCWASASRPCAPTCSAFSRRPGLGEAAITELKIVQAAASRLARGQVKRREILSSWSNVLDYCRTTMAFDDTEKFRVLFLDKKNQLLADEVQQTGTVDHTPVYPREAVKRALELSASAVILVHKNPTRNPTPLF